MKSEESLQLAKNWLEMAEPVLFSFVQNHDPYIPRKNEKKAKKQEKTKKTFTLIAESFWAYLFEPFFTKRLWTFISLLLCYPLKFEFLLMKLMKRPGGETEAGIYFQQLRK